MDSSAIFCSLYFMLFFVVSTLFCFWFWFCFIFSVLARSSSAIHFSFLYFYYFSSFFFVIPFLQLIEKIAILTRNSVCNCEEKWKEKKYATSIVNIINYVRAQIHEMLRFCSKEWRDTIKQPKKKKTTIITKTHSHSQYSDMWNTRCGHRSQSHRIQTGIQDLWCPVAVAFVQ